MLQRNRRADYHSYLLRLWRPDADAPWQASLQSTASGETRRFSDVDSLYEFLSKELDSGEDPPPPAEDTS